MAKTLGEERKSTCRGDKEKRGETPDKEDRKEGRLRRKVEEEHTGGSESFTTERSRKKSSNKIKKEKRG